MALSKFKNFITETERKAIIEKNVTKYLLPSDLDIPVFLMNPPLSMDASSPNNALMKDLPPKDRKVNTLKAVEQFLSVYNFLTKSALVYLLPAVEGLGDIPWVANLGILLPHIPNNKTIIISNYKTEIRRGETVVGVNFFHHLGYDTIIAPQYFEGEADLKFLNGNTYCGAVGQRTTIEALKWFERSFDMKVIPVEVLDNCYHLDCLLFPLEDHKLVAATPLMDKKTIKEIEKHVNVISVSKESGKQGLTNCVRFGNFILNGTYIHHYKKGTDDYDAEKDKNDELEKICAKEGYEPIFFSITEAEKNGAALSCMIMHMNWPHVNVEPV